MPSVAVVVLNWNGKYFLEKFLPSLIQHTALEARIVVADNNSSDDSVAFLAASYPSVEVIKLDKNYGFCEGYNRALQHIDSQYFVLLNSDVEVTANWLSPMIALLEGNRKIAVCQPKVLSYDVPSQFEYAGAAGGLIDKFGFPFCRGRVFDHLETDTGQYNDTKKIFWATGACLAIRADLYKSIGGLDADFFAHMEEIDLCWRLINHGYEIYYCGASTVYHVGGGTLHKSSPRKTYLNFRNNLFLLHKNLPKNALVKTILVRMIFDGVAGITLLFKSGFGHFAAVLKAHFAYYRQIKALNAKRKLLSIPDTLPCNVYNKSIVVDYFLRNKKVKTY